MDLKIIPGDGLTEPRREKKMAVDGPERHDPRDRMPRGSLFKK